MTNDQQGVISPCIGECALDERELCRGCYRSITEIIGWGDKPDEQKRQILLNCAHRKQGMEVS